MSQIAAISIFCDAVVQVMDLSDLIQRCSHKLHHEADYYKFKLTSAGYHNTDCILNAKHASRLVEACALLTQEADAIWTAAKASKGTGHSSGTTEQGKFSMA